MCEKRKNDVRYALVGTCKAPSMEFGKLWLFCSELATPVLVDIVATVAKNITF